jgi:membrane fusion protein (multidrug efflux system)
LQSILTNHCFRLDKNTKVRFKIIVVYTISLWLTSCSDEPKNGASNGAQRQRGMLSAEAIVLKKSEIENKIISIGSLLPNEEVIVRSEVAGRVVEINFEEGAEVKKGQLLVKLNSDDLEAEHQRLKLELDLAETELGRREELFKIDGISQEELDIARNRVAIIKADIALNKSRLDKTNILAPFSGQIGLRSISLGSYLSPETSVAQLRQTDKLKLEFSVPEIYSTAMKKGLQVHFTVSGYQREFEGVVYAVEPGVDISTRSLKVRAEVPNKSKRLLPGSFANVTLVLEDIEDALMVPTNSLVPEMRQQKVWKVENGKLTSKVVEVGIRTDSKVQVSGGVAEGDTILVTGILQAREGSPVNVKIRE